MPGDCCIMAIDLAKFGYIVEECRVLGWNCWTNRLACHLIRRAHLVDWKDALWRRWSAWIHSGYLKVKFWLKSVLKSKYAISCRNSLFTIESINCNISNPMSNILKSMKLKTFELAGASVAVIEGTTTIKYSVSTKNPEWVKFLKRSQNAYDQKQGFKVLKNWKFMFQIENMDAKMYNEILSDFLLVFGALKCDFDFVLHQYNVFKHKSESFLFNRTSVNLTKNMCENIRILKGQY
ncbi:hypothetical protein BpHYR1_051901 [Brachionus plicatilis]|uniref:Uncharacterized protein n=1 Tax=Brachionus plicatilis TaxID=10195 RepID=A0A3M7RLQ4_BRAPC|nr:hypothetical protein BpHYR1_051901 [Brachionus plicatilis]